MNQHSLKSPRTLLRGVAIAFLASCMVSVTAVEVGDLAPSFSLQTTDSTFTSTQLAGKLSYIDFWASWCVPCKLSFPWMNEMQHKYRERGFQVVAVNVDKKRADADKFLARYPAAFAVAFDAAGDTPKKFAVPGMPTAYLVDPNGHVVYVHSGFREGDPQKIEAAIIAALEAMKKK